MQSGSNNPRTGRGFAARHAGHPTEHSGVGKSDLLNCLVLEADRAGYVQVLTMHRSKSMEFSRVVILAGAASRTCPQRGTFAASSEEELEETLLRERSLLYVATSRARDELVITWTGERSELLG